MHGLKLAAIDIGSNSIKLAVADAADSQSFAVVTREKDVIRLRHETLRKGRLSRAVIDRAITCIQRFNTIAETHQRQRTARSRTQATPLRAVIQSNFEFQRSPGESTARLTETLWLKRKQSEDSIAARLRQQE
jgi:hypothetical protein